MNYYVYILSNNTNTVVYIGVTNNLLRRVWQHQNCIDPESFTARYHVHKLVYYEHTSDVRAAIEREKQIKKWNRKRKNELVERYNPGWVDLYDTIKDES
jgi:putative endonuclease